MLNVVLEFLGEFFRRCVACCKNAAGGVGTSTSLMHDTVDAPGAALIVKSSGTIVYVYVHSWL